eukprot:1651621-Prymnesium_polylepis.1
MKTPPRSCYSPTRACASCGQMPNLGRRVRSPLSPHPNTNSSGASARKGAGGGPAATLAGHRSAATAHGRAPGARNARVAMRAPK